MNFSFDSNFASQLDEDKIELLWLIAKSDCHYFVQNKILAEKERSSKIL